MTKRSILAATLILAGTTLAQAQTPAQWPAATPAPSANIVSRTTKALNYRLRGGSVKIEFSSTELMSGASGEARVEGKKTSMEIDARFASLDDPTKFGLEYLTYVLWAISPEGKAINLGELVLDHGASHVKAITDQQTFGMIVTAEPYFAVSQPSNVVVLENSVGALSGRSENIDARFELVARGTYSSSNTRIENAIFGIDPKTPRALFEARNSVRIAHIALADKYAPAILTKAETQLRQAEEAYQRKQGKSAIDTASRETVETAEEARVMAVKQKAEEDAQAKAAADKKAAEDRALAEAKARAEAEVARKQAEADRAQAEAAKVEAERLKLEAQKANEEAQKEAAAAAKAKEEADAARAAALQQQQAAEAEAQQARQAAARAEAEKAELRAQLLAQLNAVLQTRDTVRGLIVNMSDVLFDTGKYTLRAAAREKLSKSSGIVVAHPGLRLSVEGHTDSVGSDQFNQTLSEVRAGGVRDYLVSQGVPADSISSTGFGKTQPIATNDTPEGRQQNRRVELVVNGDAIGAATAQATPPQHQN